MKQIYENGVYLMNNPSWHEEDSKWKSEQIKKIVKKNALSPESVCEIGSGAGEILNQLREEGLAKEFYGYEISPQAYKYSLKKTKPNLKFKFSDLLEEKSVYFDIVMAIDVLEHVEDYIGFLKKLKNKAEYKIFHIPIDLKIPTILFPSSLIKCRKSVGHIHYFTKETALESLKDTGYEIIDYFYTGSFVDLPSKDWRTKLLKIPRKLAFRLNKDVAVRLLGGYSLLVLTK